MLGLKEKGKIKLPPIGLRIIKSAVAVFMCYIVDFLRGGSGIVFYSQLSALWCMQDYSDETIKNAKQRTVGTLVGAVFGFIVLMIDRKVKMKGFTNAFIQATMISIAIVLIIYATVLLKRRNASYFSCVVFLSIVVNHANDVNPYLFVFNRVLDTMIGIAIGVLVNTFTIHRRKQKDILFVSGLDDTLLNKNNNMTGYSKVELNRMIDSGLMFTVSTQRTPASLMEPLSDIKLKLPVIAMDGAALYNIEEKCFEKVYIMSKQVSRSVEKFFEKNRVSFFTNIVIDDTVMIYYSASSNEIYNKIVAKLRKSPYRNYIKRPVPIDEPVVYFMTIDKKIDIEILKQKLLAEEVSKELKITVTDSDEYEGYSYLRVYSHNASKENMMQYLLQGLEVKKVVTFGTIPGRYTHLIKPGDTNKVVHLMKKEYEK